MTEEEKVSLEDERRERDAFHERLKACFARIRMELMPEQFVEELEKKRRKKGD